MYSLMHCGPISSMGWDGSPDGVRIRKPFGAEKKSTSQWLEVAWWLDLTECKYPSDASVHLKPWFSILFRKSHNLIRSDCTLSNCQNSPPLEMEGNFLRSYDTFYWDVMFLEKDISTNIYPASSDPSPVFSIFDKNLFPDFTKTLLPPLNSALQSHSL